MTQLSMTTAIEAVPVAGIDVGKKQLDIAVPATNAIERLPNTPAGHQALVAWLTRLGVKRVGLEATGGYERGVLEALRRAGFETLLLQPRQVRGWALFKLRRAKSPRQNPQRTCSR